MSHDTAARRVFGVTLETIVRRILATFDRATPADLETGARWYGEAREIAQSIADSPDIRHELATVVGVISALSPRTSWSRNIAGAVAFFHTGHEAARKLGCIGANVDRALDVVDGLPLKGPKTRAFAANILGDVETVTVDVWALRVANLDETAIGRKGAYEAVAHAYRLAARRRGVDPSTMQATTWIVARNGRAS